MSKTRKTLKLPTKQERDEGYAALHWELENQEFLRANYPNSWVWIKDGEVKAAAKNQQNLIEIIKKLGKWPDKGVMPHLTHVGFPLDKCQNCGVREGTEKWAGNLDSINSIRMSSSLPMWCKLCIAKAQLEHARTEGKRLIDSIPGLEAEVTKLEML